MTKFNKKHSKKNRKIRGGGFFSKLRSKFSKKKSVAERTPTPHQSKNSEDQKNSIIDRILNKLFFKLCDKKYQAISEGKASDKDFLAKVCKKLKIKDEFSFKKPKTSPTKEQRFQQLFGHATPANNRNLQREAKRRQNIQEKLEEFREQLAQENQKKIIEEQRRLLNHF
jgi:hypothetical protein